MVDVPFRFDPAYAAEHGHWPTHTGTMCHHRYTVRARDHWWQKRRSVERRDDFGYWMSCTCGWIAPNDGPYHAWTMDAWHDHVGRAIAQASDTIVGIVCHYCQGQGEVDWRDAQAAEVQFVTAEAKGVTTATCPICGGVGRLPAFRCARCRGRGEVEWTDTDDWPEAIKQTDGDGLMPCPDCRS